MKDLYFDVRDIFRTSRIALSGKKIWVHLIGLFTGWIIYLILTYLAFIINGLTIPEIWQTYHLFPSLCASAGAFPWYSWLIYGIGIFIWVAVFLYFSVAVARITYKQLKGDEFFSSGDSLKYAKKHGKSAILAPISIILIIAFFIVMAIIAAWISKWPVLDILFFGLPYLLYFVVAVFVIYTALALIVSIILGPAIIGSAEEDTMETVFQSYSTLWSQPWRLICYEGLVGLLSVVATFIYGYFMVTGFKFFNYVFGQSWLMGDKIEKITSAASSYFCGSNSPLAEYFVSLFGDNSTMILFIKNINASAGTGLGVTGTITTILVTIAILFIFTSVIAYALTNITVGQTLIYVVLRNKKDEENLLERKDEDELEEEEEMEADFEEEELPGEGLAEEDSDIEEEIEESEEEEDKE